MIRFGFDKDLEVFLKNLIKSQPLKESDKVPIIMCDPRGGGTISGMYSIQGLYKIGMSEVPERQIRDYDVETVKEAIDRAKEDGLVSFFNVEQYFGERIACNLHKGLK